MTTAAPATPSIASIATTAETVVEDVMKVEPTVATIAAMFVPGAAPIVAMIQPEVLLAAPFVENALKSLSAGNNGDVLTSFIQLLQHLTPGQTNSAILAAPLGSPASATITNS
jgi:hypothetical protein